MMQVTKWSLIALAVAAASTQTATASQQSESQGFVADSSLNLLLRNTYWNRDFNHGVNDAKVWGQGFIGTFESGFTQGIVGFGFDAYGLLGVKLDSGPGRNYNKIFLTDSDGDPVDDLSEAGGAVKARFSNTVVKYGNQFPSLPVLAYDDSRMLPQSFTGTLITSTEIEGLEINAGHFTQDSPMASPAHDGGHLKSNNVIGASYLLNDNWKMALYASDVEDVYKKKYANLNFQLPLSDAQSFGLDFNIYKTDYDDEFESTAGGDDNTLWSLAGTYTLGAHAFILAYQQNSGDTGYLYDYGDGGWAIFVSNSFYSDFVGDDEKSLQASYELNAADYGIPGLAYKIAYVYGTDINTPTDNDAKERELFNQVKYTIQNGPAKDLAFRVRNSIYRASNSYSGYSTDVNEWRIFIEYPLSIL